MNAPTKYYAHSSSSGEHWHRLSEHLDGTGARAADLLDAVGCADVGRVAGLLHDLGKYTREFQDRLSGGRRVNHSTAGAQGGLLSRDWGSERSLVKYAQEHWTGG